MTDCVTWVNVNSLPPGLTINTDGVIAGRPTWPGDYRFHVSQKCGTEVSEKEMTMRVEPNPLVPLVLVLLAVVIGLGLIRWLEGRR